MTHTDRGTPDLTEKTHQALVHRILEKLKAGQDWLPSPECILCEDANTVVVAYGSQSRPSLDAVIRAREQGISAGLLRLRTCWPFPREILQQLSKQTQTMVVPELSTGQLIWPVERFAHRDAQIIHLPKIGGNIVTSTEILLALGGSLA